MSEDIADIIRLIGTEGIGAVSFFKYLKQYKTVQNALTAVSKKQKILSLQAAQYEIELATKKGIRILAYNDKNYPQALLTMADPPPVLYALGNIELLNYPYTLAIVGARNASIGGRKTASRIAYDLTQNDVLIVSGMARGIDAAAHKGAMYAKEEHGPTIAVLGTGVDVIYPQENTPLYQSIIHQGVAVSEFKLQTPAQVGNFPRRNRIIAGLALGTLVVEASEHSGSLITAKSALEQGKEVFAVPGSPLDSRSNGPNKLIKDGAILTENSNDILNTLENLAVSRTKNLSEFALPLDKTKNNVIMPKKKTNVSAAQKSNSKTEGTLLDEIGFEGVEIDALIRSAKMEQSKFFEELLSLEFEGKIVRIAGNKVARVK